MNESDVTSLALFDSPYPIWVQILLWFVVILVSLETIIGNAFVLLAYKLDRSISKQISNRYVVSLAVSDLIIGFEGFPFFTIYVVNGLSSDFEKQLTMILRKLRKI